MPATNDQPPIRAARFGTAAHAAGSTLHSVTIGALPILNHFFRRMRLEELLLDYLPPADRRCTIPVARGLLLLVQNYLIARAPLYGISAWAAEHAPEMLGLEPSQLAALNDDRLGRGCSILADSDYYSVVLAVAAHCITEFAIDMDEMHNDSTTLTFHGTYAAAATAKLHRGRLTPAITWGHNKDHRPDLKQLLFILTVSQDGGVPLCFRTASGNVTDDSTHRATWESLCQLAGRRDFLYVADCKLATVENMSYIAGRGGRFVSVLPATRAEDAVFRTRLAAQQVSWQHLWDKTNARGKLLDTYSICPTPCVTAEGYRLLWYHSTRKAQLDAMTRTGKLQRALAQLDQLQQRLQSPRTRYQQRGKVQDAVTAILENSGVSDWIAVDIQEQVQASYHQERPGRPSADTRYWREERIRFVLCYRVLQEQLTAATQADGVFPLVSNADNLSPLELLHAYKRQPVIEKRFEQLKTDYAVAPVWLKDVGRIEGLLCVYFFALLTEALIERELRRGLERAGLESIPLYPEDRSCERPTTRRLLDVFAPIQRHDLWQERHPPVRLVTELSPLQRQLLRLLGISTNNYGH